MNFRVLASVSGLFVSVAATTAAHAESENLSATYKNCMDKSGGVTVDMIDCMQAEYEKQDKRLNAVYKVVMKGTEGTRARDLKEAQRAWLKFRDLNCGYIYNGEGTIARVAGASCLMQMTADRADELQGFGEAQ